MENMCDLTHKYHQTELKDNLHLSLSISHNSKEVGNFFFDAV